VSRGDVVDVQARIEMARPDASSTPSPARRVPARAGATEFVARQRAAQFEVERR
jgi:hypothetical protein